jgi:choline dehydrogenase-like flavoprotein
MNSPETLIIGSGPSGISAAWPMVLAGREVALVDGMDQSMPLPPAMSIQKFREDPASWKYIYGSDLSGLYIDKNISPKFATPIGQRLLAEDSFNSRLNLRDFFGQRALMPGGQSLVWGAFCSAFDNRDLMGFPIDQSDLMDGYKSVASRIGLSGNNDDMGEFHGAYYDLHQPPALNSVAADVLDGYKRIKFNPNEFKLGLARNAVITRNFDGREGCNECGLCLYGCSRNSIYSSDLEIEKLKKFPNFKYFPNTVVSKLISLNSIYKKIEINRSSIIDARRLVLAAGTITTTATMLICTDKLVQPCANCV